MELNRPSEALAEYRKLLIAPQLIHAGCTAKGKRQNWSESLKKQRFASNSSKGIALPHTSKARIASCP
jgi:hypothetical protein